MTDKPILFTAPMVRAILTARKTQTRRALNPQPNILNGGHPLYDGFGSYSVADGWKKISHKAGDTLWVRETVQIYGNWSKYFDNEKKKWRWKFKAHKSRQVRYEDEGFYIPLKKTKRLGWYTRPSIFMPRWASRISLRVTAVKVERLQDISEADAVAEGCDGKVLYNPDAPTEWDGTPRIEYEMLWDRINGKGSWDANPWVAAYTFERIKP